jgi:hypothetical protein
VAMHQDAVKIKLKMLYGVHFMEEAWLAADNTHYNQELFCELRLLD